MLKIFAIALILSVSNLLSAQNSTNVGSFGQKDEHIANFTGYIYYIPENKLQLPDFSKLTPVGEIYTDSINVPDQDFMKGFPGVTNRFEFFAIDYKGEFYMKDSTILSFILCSDDGSKLLIDEKLIINNDYGHSFECKLGMAKLRNGVHTIEVQYFQDPRDRVALTLQIKKANEKSFQLFSLSKLYPIEMVESDSAINLTIGDEILFDFNSYKLSKVATQALKDVKRLIIDKIQISAIIIEGHTDDVGTVAYNLKLSLKRAEAVKHLFMELGINPTVIVTKGLGKSKPKLSNTSDENRKANRRIEITLKK